MTDGARWRFPGRRAGDRVRPGGEAGDGQCRRARRDRAGPEPCLTILIEDTIVPTIATVIVAVNIMDWLVEADFLKVISVIAGVAAAVFTTWVAVLPAHVDDASPS